MTRAEILADTLARLEAERYAPRASWSLDKVPPISPEQGEANMHRLLAAMKDDGVVIDFYERKAG